MGVLGITNKAVGNRPRREAPMGSHIMSMDPWLPPWLLNQSANDTLSRFLTASMPPSGSIRALTTGDVPRAKELAACVYYEAGEQIPNL